MNQQRGQMAKKYTCQHCGASFSKLGLLIQHRRTLGHKDVYPCNICQKTFGRKNNLDRHIMRHKNGSLFRCNDCGTLFSRPDSWQRHQEDKHNQVDRGLKRRAICDGNTMLKRRITGKDDPETFYDLRIMSTQQMPKFNTQTTRCKVSWKKKLY